MQSVEILTPNQVFVEYETAGVKRRIFAFLIDAIVSLLTFALLYVLGKTIEFQFLQSLVIFSAYSILIFYSLILEIYTCGSTLGKYMLGIRVVKLNGDEVQFFDYFLRWSMRLIDIILSVGIIAVFSVATSKSAQRLGDLLANTTVVKIPQSANYSLDTLLKLNDVVKLDFQLTEQQIKCLSDQVILLIKETIHRYKIYPNTAHQAAVGILTTKISELLDIKETSTNINLQIKFLNKIVQAYVISTR